MDRIISEISTIAVAIIGLATLAVIVSRNAATSDVIKSSAQGFSSILGAAVSPVTGGGFAGGGFTFGNGW